MKFNQVDAQFNLIQIEKDILKRWDDLGIFEKINEATKSNPPWVYYDGPITANGQPHYGHAITWTMKDILPRYYSMNDRFVSRNMGWDCQGILVEYEVEKELGFQSKADIEKFGIAKFNELCRQSVLKHRDVMEEYEQRLGRWIDHNDEYATMDPTYIESMWWSLKELYNKGLLYKGHKVVAYSTRAGMTLSAHEVADGGYKEIVDPAVTVKFELIDEPNTFLLAWTTTPWTLPGNLLLAVGKNIEYVKIKIKNENWILARDLVEKILGETKYEIISEISSTELVGKEYKALFKHFEDRKSAGAFKIVYGDHVNTETGTGVVHLAPYGEEDFVILSGLKIPMFDYLDDSGTFTNLVPELEGQFYKKANNAIIKMLQENETLVSLEEYAHQMPMCYRTKTPLIYRPIESYYVAIEKMRDRMVEEAKKINFVPEAGGERFLRWIENARDWSLSRRRYWGTPLPIWVNDVTGEVVIIGSFKELEEYSGKKLPEDFDPHKPFIDEITWEKDGGTFKRLPEVLDVWYDSGSMPFAKHHYPFKNQENFKQEFPAEYISEGDDQLRLWFYTMFVLGVALFDKAPFKNVIVIGMLGDEHGKKMSKSAGNYPPFKEIFEKYGSDMLRYFLLKNGVARMEPTAFSYTLLEETKKELFTMLWNSYRYFLTYADLNDFNPDTNFKPNDVLDKWILMRLAELVNHINDNLQSYEVMYATRELAPFVDDLSTWYIRRSRDKISSGDKDSLNTLYIVLLTLSKLMAPFMPLLSDDIYLGLNGGKESVHLESYPKNVDIEVSEDLLLDMSQIRIAASIGNSIRKEVNIPIRQVLSKVYVEGFELKTAGVEELLKDELNVKDVVWGELVGIVKEENGVKVALDTEVTEELAIEGAARELIREIQKLRKESNVDWSAEIDVQYKQSELFDKAISKLGEDIKKKTLVKNISAGDEFKLLLESHHESK